MAEETMESIANEQSTEGIEGIADGGSEKPGEAGGDNSVGGGDGEGGAPDKGGEDYELEAIEGFPLPAEGYKSFAAAAKAAGLSKEQAQKLMGWHKDYWENGQKNVAQQEKEVIAGWQKQIMADPEIGGMKWKQSLADSRRALAMFDPEGKLRTLLKEMKADYHPDVVRVIARVGKAMSEHQFVAGVPGGEGRANTPLEDRMWPGMK